MALFKKRKFKPRVSKNKFSEPKKCRFCQDQVVAIGYKDTQYLQKLANAQGRMFSRKRGGNCARHQRMAKLAVKRARFLALIPYV
ncbi:MAG: 30S ribosomal protein S18 [Candidatus Anammoxibacter sp.]